MPVELLLPRVKVPAPPMPSYVKLAMAFGVGAGATLFDKSRYRSHGAITTAAWAAGLHGYCLDFNPAGPDVVTIPAAHTQLDFTSEDFSFVFRMNIDDLTGNRWLIQRYMWNTSGYSIGIQIPGNILVYTFQAGAFQQSKSSAGDIVVGTWYTVGVSRSGASIRLFKNGVDVTLAPGVHVDPATHIGVAKIGVDFDGKIEFNRVFGGIALSTSEHLAWHNALA